MHLIVDLHKTIIVRREKTTITIVTECFFYLSKSYKHNDQL